MRAEKFIWMLWIPEVFVENDTLDWTNCSPPPPPPGSSDPHLQKEPIIMWITVSVGSSKGVDPWALFQYPVRRLIVRACEVSKPRDLCLALSDCSEIWQTHRQQYCRGTCQLSKRCDNSNYQSRSFETSRVLMIRRLIRYCNGTLLSGPLTSVSHQTWDCGHLTPTACLLPQGWF